MPVTTSRTGTGAVRWTAEGAPSDGRRRSTGLALRASPGAAPAPIERDLYAARPDPALRGGVCASGGAFFARRLAEVGKNIFFPTYEY